MRINESVRLWRISPGHVSTWPYGLPSTSKHSPTPLFYSSILYLLAAAAHSSLLSDCVPKVLDSQDSIVWSDGDKNMVAACLPGSVLDMFSVTLFCVIKTELNMTLLVVQTILPAMSHLFQIHTINTKTHCNLVLGIALMFQFDVQDTSQTQRPLPDRNLNLSFLLLCFSFFLPSNPPPFPSCPPFAPFLPETPVE